MVLSLRYIKRQERPQEKKDSRGISIIDRTFYSAVIEGRPLKQVTTLINKKSQSPNFFLLVTFTFLLNLPPFCFSLCNIETGIKYESKIFSHFSNLKCFSLCNIERAIKYELNFFSFSKLKWGERGQRGSEARSNHEIPSKEFHRHCHNPPSGHCVASASAFKIESLRHCCKVAKVGM